MNYPHNNPPQRPYNGTYTPTSNPNIPPNTNPPYGHYGPTNPTNPGQGAPSGRRFEPYLRIEVNFSTNIKTLQSNIAVNQVKIAEKIENEFNCFVRIDGSAGRTLFAIGFLLTKGVISHSPFIDWDAQQKQLRSSFETPQLFPLVDRSQQDTLLRYKLLITNLFNMAETTRRDNLMPLDDEITTVKFIVEQCKSDNELVNAIVYMGRCALIEWMFQGNISKTMPQIYSKLKSMGWETEDAYSADLPAVFSQCFQYKITHFKISDFQATEKIFHGHSKNEATIFDSTYKTMIKALLFRERDQLYNGQILARNKPDQGSVNNSPYQPRNMPNQGIGANNSPYQTKNPAEVSPMKPVNQELEHCSLCGQDIVQRLVYINPYCKHRYCLYCVQELAVVHPDLKFCYLKRCDGRLEQSDIRAFRTRAEDEVSPKKQQEASADMISGGQNQFQSPIGPASRSRIYNERPPDVDNNVQYAPRRLPCSMCDEEVNENNPIVFGNASCGHSFCKKWFIKNNPMFEALCFMNRCPRSVDVYVYKNSMKDAGDIKFNIKCNGCMKGVDSSKVFINPKCRHRYCLECVEQLRAPFCQVLSCRETIDESKLEQFKEDLIVSEYNQNLVKNSMICSGCNHEVDINLPHGSRLDYWKCSNCTMVSCTQHNRLMSQCLCFCPKCSGSLYENSGMKNCSRCMISYCMRCKRENEFRQPCLCAEAEQENTMATATIKQAKVALATPLMEVVTKVKECQNTCNDCNDFREAPDYFILACGHRLCEHCVLARQKGYYPKGVTCSICS